MISRIETLEHRPMQGKFIVVRWKFFGITFFKTETQGTYYR